MVLCWWYGFYGVLWVVGGIWFVGVFFVGAKLVGLAFIFGDLVVIVVVVLK